MAGVKHAFAGAAGTGKTYRLMEVVREFGANKTLATHQRVLGLTFMHGSRRRMAQRLSSLTDNGVRSDVQTLDAFALHLVRRFRRHLGLSSGGIRVLKSEGVAGWIHSEGIARGTFKTIRSAGSRLLQQSAIRAAVRSSYPLILIDEIQDCDASLLTFVQRLAEATTLACAGDHFQDLERLSGRSPAIEWLKSETDIVRLTQQHRTTESAILVTAKALRENIICSEGVPIVGLAGAGFAAYEIQRRIGWDEWHGQLAIITPTGPDASSWVKAVVRYTANDKADGKLKPFPFQWEESESDHTDRLVAEVLQPFVNARVVTPKALRSAAEAQRTASFPRRCYDRVLRRSRLAGLEEISVSAIVEEAHILAHSLRRRTGVADRERFRLAMTVHGAKNREFDYVFVLWPRAIKSGHMRHRRLLYNAITRARKDAVILVEGEERPSHDPLLRRLTGMSAPEAEGDQLLMQV